MSALPATPIGDLLLSVRRAAALQWMAIAVLGVIGLALAALALHQSGELAWQARHQPIHVVPGAAEGVYAPGLAHHNLLNAARYLAGLAVNLTPSTAAQRLAELERYVDPQALAVFRAERDRRLREIREQQQGRTLRVDQPDTLERTDDLYRYRVQGRWEIRSGSLPMSEVRHIVEMRFRVGTADETNPYGIRIVALDVTALETVGDAVHE